MSLPDSAPTEPQDHGKVVKTKNGGASWAWLFPIMAAAAAAWFFWSNWKQEGPKIEIHFVTAPGVQAGKTPLIYRGVIAGKVTNVRLDSSLKEVVVVVRLNEFAAGLAREHTDFWVDKAVISLRETRGLDSLIQGNSIHARTKGGAYATHFQGLENAPLVTTENPGLIAYLKAPAIWFLDRGTPIYYHGTLVGLVGDKTLDTNGQAVLTVGFTQESVTWIKDNSRFWVLPATSLTISPRGAQVNIAGLDSLVQGGIALDQFTPGGKTSTNGEIFTLSPTEMDARADGSAIHILFDDGRGLLPGETRICYLGQPIGVVVSAHPDPNNGNVDATVHLESAYSNFVNSDTLFTLVRPKISPHGVSGLETLITGAYINCRPGDNGQPTDHFVATALNDDELDASGIAKQGIHLTLTADRLPTISKGAPVIYRGLVAGTILGKEINAKGIPILSLTINTAFKNVLHANSRFWRVPATSVSAGPGVIKAEIESISSLLDGGVAFDNFDPPSELATQNSHFTLFDNRELANATSSPFEILFEDAQGILPRNTQIRYLGVPVGIVENVQATEKGVAHVTARLQPGYDFLRRADSTFFLVEPSVSLNGGIKGLETVLSGDYIECVPGVSSTMANSFTGNIDNDAQLLEHKGFEVTISSPSTSIRPGAIVMYRETKVGVVTAKRLAKDGSHVLLTLDIDPQYRNLLRANSWFWDASDAEIAIGFIKVKIRSPLMVALNGQIYFTTPDTQGEPVEKGHSFELHHVAPPKDFLK